MLNEEAGMKKNIHIGKLIKRRMLEQGFTVSDFASAINRTRATVYDIFERKSIDVDLLLSISEVLEFDFFSYYISDASLLVRPEDAAKEKYIVVKLVDKERLDDEGDVISCCKLDV